MVGWYIQGAHLVRPEGVEAQGHLWTIDDRIGGLEGPPRERAGYTRIQAEGLYVLPGLIDLHTDTLELEICPRRMADFPLALALQELDAKLLACGITTVYHALHYGYQQSGWGQKSAYTRDEIFAAIHELAPRACLARTRAHVRFEIAGHDASDDVVQLLRRGHGDMLSFMDHTPGQGQYSAERFIQHRLSDGKTRAEAAALLAEAQARPKVNQENLAALARLALSRGLTLASHDDCTPEKVDAMHALGVRICEFPINPASAERAGQLGMTRLGGSTNYLRGGSLTGNLNVGEALHAGQLDGLCTDYYPPSMLQAVFKLWREDGWDLARATALATAVPAQAVGENGQLGQLAAGRAADFILVDNRGFFPRVVATFVGGRCVHQLTDLSPRLQMNVAPPPLTAPLN